MKAGRSAPGKGIDPSKVNRILVRATNWVGDVVMSLPALEAVKENFPGCTLSVAARPWVSPIFESHPSVDRVFLYERPEGALRSLEGILRLAGKIRREGHDMAILFQNAFEAALLCLLGGVRYRIGYGTDGRGPLLSHRIPLDPGILRLHQSEYYLEILRSMGWTAESRYPRLYVEEESVRWARRTLGVRGKEERSPVVGLGPGAVYGNAKRWPPERFAEIGRWAAERWGAEVVLMGSQGEVEICRQLCRCMEYRPLNLCGRTSLSEAIGLISEFSLFVTNDSGLMHIAAALGVPTLAIFGPTDHVATGPQGPRTALIRHETACAPCLKQECPRDHRCMLSIEPEEVWERMEMLREEVE